MSAPAVSLCEPNGSSLMGDSEYFFDLLALPGPVVDVFVAKVAESSFRSLLNLREVCQTTKSWIDDYPERNAKAVMSKVQVCIKVDPGIVKQFNVSSPPFAVTSLTLNVIKQRQEEDPESILGTAALFSENEEPDTESMWNEFFDYWNSRLECLEIQKEMYIFEDSGTTNNEKEEIRRVIRRLLASPRLKKVIFLKNVDWLLMDPFPETFMRITDLVIDGISKELSLLPFGRERTPQIEDKFYSNLEKNKNLTNVAFKITGNPSIRLLKSFIDATKNNDKLKVSLITCRDFHVGFDHVKMQLFLDLIRSAVASKSQISFNLTFIYYGMRSTEFFTEAKARLTSVEYAKFTNLQIKSLNNIIGNPLEMIPVLNIQCLEGLKSLEIHYMLPDALGNFRFPPNLEALACGAGFPTAGNIPVTVTDLVLRNIRCGFEELEASLAAIDAQCVNLKKLEMVYTIPPETTLSDCGGGRGEPAEMTLQFRNLKSLILKTYMNKGDGEQDILLARELLFNRLRIDKIPLHHLTLSTRRLDIPNINIDNYPLHSPVSAYNEWRALNGFGRDEEEHLNTLTLLDEYFFNRLCEGPIGSSLMFLGLVEWSFTPTGSSGFERLTSKLKANIETRIEKEGRGPWLREYPILSQDCFFWIS